MKFPFTTLKSQNILLFNFYLILFLQLIFNWSYANCNNHTNVWKLFYMFVLFARIFGDEFYHNRMLSANGNKGLKVVTSLILLFMGIAMIAILARNKEDFDEGVCFSNRI